MSLKYTEGKKKTIFQILRNYHSTNKALCRNQPFHVFSQKVCFCPMIPGHGMDALFAATGRERLEGSVTCGTEA